MLVSIWPSSVETGYVMLVNFAVMSQPPVDESLDCDGVQLRGVA